MTSDSRVATCASAIGFLRAATGALGYVAPALFTRAALLPDAGKSADVRYVTRLFAARDLVVGAMSMFGPTRSAGIQTGVACDLLDTGSALLANHEGKDPKWSARAGLVAFAFAVAGTFTARELRNAT